MKKFIALFTTISVIFTSLALCIPSYAQAETNEDYAEDMSILSSLGIFSDLPSNENAVISRGLFISGVMNLIGSEANFDKNQSPFYDVTSADKYYNQIVLAAHMGIITGDENKNFHPNDTITYMEALVMLVRGLNYNVEYPSGYLNLASRLKISRGINLSLDDNITAGVCARLILKAGEASANKIENIDENGENILWDRHKIAKSNGVLEKNEFTSLTSDKGCDENKVVIGGETYSLYDNSKCYDYLGHNVEVYYKTENDKAVILHIADYDTGVKTIKADEIVDFSGQSLKYTEKNSMKSISVPKTATIIYNGTVTLTNTDKNGNNIFKPNTGKIEFIDNNGDGVYEVVSVTSCTTAVVSSVDAKNKIINNYYYPDKKLDFGEAERNENVWILTDESGVKIEPQNVKENSVITYALSLNDKVLRGIVSTKTETGTVSAQKTEDGDKYITVGGIEYKLNADFEKSGAAMPKLNDTVTVLMDYEGRIAGIKGKADSKAQYGFYIKSAVSKDGFNPKAYAKIMDTVGKGGTQEFEFADKVVVDGVKYDDKTYNSGENHNLYDYLTVPEGYSRTKQYINNENKDCLEPFQVILYKTDSEGKISYIDTERKGANEDENTLTKINVVRDYYDWAGAGSHFFYVGSGDYSIVGMGDNTKIILTPEYDDMENYYGYRLIKDIEIETRGRSQFKISAYTTNSRSRVPEIIHFPYEYRTEVVDASISALVKDVNKSLTDDGGEAYFLNYYSDMREYSYFAEPNLDLSDIKAGDIVKIELNAENKICALKKQCEYDPNTKTLEFKDSSLGTLTNHGGGSQHYIGYNYNVEGTVVTMLKNKTEGITSANIDSFPIISIYAGIYVVSSGRNTTTVKEISVNDMKDISNYRDGMCEVPVFMRLASAVPRMVVFYEEN